MNNIDPALFKPLEQEWESVGEESEEVEVKVEVAVETEEVVEEEVPLPEPEWVDLTMECDEPNLAERELILTSRSRIPVEMRQLPKFGQIVSQLLWKVRRSETTDG